MSAEYNQMNDDNNGKEEMMDQNSQNDEQNYSQDCAGNGDGADSGPNNNNGGGENTQQEDDGNFNGNGNGNGNQDEEGNGGSNQEDNGGNDENGNANNGAGNGSGGNENENQGDDPNNASMEPEQFRKVFIGGLSYKTDDDALKAYFGKYGDLVDHVVMKDSQTGRSRGFGFVTYSNSSMVDELMKNRPHIIDGRQVEPKRATPREVSVILVFIALFNHILVYFSYENFPN